uniref:CinA family protein n=1 Tax=Gracilinema caldarium TaxID=215591 RepID=A0A7C3IGS5_9SPIR
MIHNLAKQVFKALQNHHQRLVCAESCTAGLISHTLASVPGVSAVLWGSFVCYQNSAKQQMLGIPKSAIQQFGPVSREIAEAMAKGALEHSSADLALAITGIAGPASDESGVPVGTVWISTAKRGEEPVSTLYQLKGSRQSIRKQGAQKALEMVLQILGS